VRKEKWESEKDKGRKEKKRGKRKMGEWKNGKLREGVRKLKKERKGKSAQTHDYPCQVALNPSKWLRH